MTYSLVICNVLYLVSMFIAAWWGFTYPNIIVDVYESGKSAIIATMMCVLSCVCLCGLNYQNYYLLIIYGITLILFLINQIFNPLNISWSRTPNYPLAGSINSQIYILVLPKFVLSLFAFATAWKIRQNELERKLSRSDPRCRCADNANMTNQRNFHIIGNQPQPQPPPPPPLPPPNASIRTPPLYPVHRPSVPLGRSPLHCQMNTLPNGPLDGPPRTPPWKDRRYASPGREYGHYFRDVYNPNY